MSTDTADQCRTTWEQGVVAALARNLGISNGDAQGIVDAESFKLAQAWVGGQSAEETATLL